LQCNQDRIRKNSRTYLFNSDDVALGVLNPIPGCSLSALTHFCFSFIVSRRLVHYVSLERRGSAPFASHAISLSRFAFTMSPVPFLSFDDARHRPLGCPVWWSLQTAFLIVLFHRNSRCCKCSIVSLWLLKVAIVGLREKPSLPLRSLRPLREAKFVVKLASDEAHQNRFRRNKPARDRTALDWALAHAVECGGWCPKGRKAEDGRIDPKCPLR